MARRGGDGLQGNFLRPPQAEFPVIRLVAEDGTRVARAETEPDRATLLELFRWMVFGRVFDQRMINLQRQGRIGTIGTIRGQEASAAGLALAMRRSDWLVGSYRELLAYIAHGVPIEAVISLYRGGVPGPFPEDVAAMPIQIVIGTQMPHAAGIALGAKLRGADDVVVGCCGDGATSEGDFHEGLNFAGVHKVPAVFFVQNNGWAISVPRARQTASETIAQKAWAYGMPGALVDGNDAVAVYAVVKEAIERARAGEGPSLIEALTYRVGPHTTSDDPRRYRTDDEVELHEKDDPIARLRRFLETEGIYEEGLQELLEEEARSVMSQAIERAEAVPDVTPEDVFDLTWAAPTEAVRRDRERTLRELREVGEVGKE
ncbi:MAG: pyruvate dehydrogenase (acetyl-transferring) E1 component subunit alpha [Thermaerobacter sp.]|nr:pyruvate dehydrogenase (acetyl-transferring) E1 component subunit alpha [Thermaerobacter sp.]